MIYLRKLRVKVAMLDTHYTKLGILVQRGKYRAISRRGSDVETLNARIRGVLKRLATKDDTIGVHIVLPLG